MTGGIIVTSQLETNIDEWRSFLEQGLAPAERITGLETQLRSELNDLAAAGLDDQEAFLVALSRLGRLDGTSREYATRQSGRLFADPMAEPDPSGHGSIASEKGVIGRTASATEAGDYRNLVVILALAIGSGLAVKAGLTWLDSDSMFHSAPLLVFPFLAAYFLLKRRFSLPVLLTISLALIALAVLVNAYPFASTGQTGPLTALHTPVVLWLLVGLAYTGTAWTSHARRMDFARLSGELAIYLALLAMGGGVLISLTGIVLDMVDVSIDQALMDWVMPFAIPGAVLVAAWLADVKRDVVGNIAPVLTKVFTPLTLVMLLVMLVALLTAGTLTDVDRGLLIALDGVLILVMALLLYATSARDPQARPGAFDVLQLVLVIAALAVDAVMLTAMLSRISAFGFSPNKIVALGLNIILLVHLVVAAWLTVRFLRRKAPFAVLERWQTTYLPVYGIWAAIVVVAFPPLFGFA